MKTAWEDMGKSVTAGVAYQKASSAPYIEGYRDGVTQMKPYLQDNPGKWAEEYFKLLGVNYSKSQWSEDLKPFLQAMIENAIAGKVDPAIMNEIQQQAAKENQEILKTLVNTLDTIVLLVDGIAAALTAYALNKSLQQLALDPEAQRLIGGQLGGSQSQAWNSLTARGKAGGLCW
jgi:hypothetical protein